MLPKIRYSDNIRGRGQDTFGGINRNPFAGDGVILDCTNLSGRYFPAMSTRVKRHQISLTNKFGDGYRGVFNHVYEDTVYTVAHDYSGQQRGARLYRTSLKESASELEPELIAEFPEWLYNDVSFTVMNTYLVVFPMGIVYNMMTDEVSNIDAVYAAIRVNGESPPIKYSDGTYKGISAEKNTVTTTGEPFPFRVGDCVVFEGSRYNDGVTAVVQEISEDGLSMSFYENTFSFEKPENDSEYESKNITISRKMPEGLTHVMCVGNRLWACGGKHIAASADGDPFNWNLFEGTDADSYQVDVLGEGNFTGCINYGGTPVFFKPSAVIKVLGDYPSAYYISETSCRGVKEGAAGTVAEVGGYLFWLSDIGMMYYGGGLPRPIGGELGKISYQYGCAASDGRRYYLSLNDGSAGGDFFTYDTETNVWYKEDSLYISSFSGKDILYGTDNYGDLVIVGDPPAHLIPDCAEIESDFASSAVFTDFTWGTLDKKEPCRIRLRAHLAKNARLSVLIKYDSVGKFEALPVDVYGNTEFTGEGRPVSGYISVVPCMCDHFTLKFEGFGEWQLSYLAIESAVSADK